MSNLRTVVVFVLAFRVCGAAYGAAGSEVIVSVADQELAFIANGKTAARFPVSTSKFGTGDAVGTYRTPLGGTFVSAKIG